MFHRTLNVPTPPPAPGANWLARALLESPSQEGPWTPIQATASLDGPVASNLAQCESGWYRIQWHDDKQVSRFSDPVPMSGHIAHADAGSNGRVGRR